MGRSTEKTNKRVNRETIAKKIRFLLHNNSTTIEELSSRIGVTRENLRYVLDGLSWPTKHLLEKLCAAFDVRMDYFGANIEETLTGSVIGPADFDDPSDLSATPVHKKSVESVDDEKPRKRKFDLAEMAAHHQALLECLIEKKLITPDDYQTKVDNIRDRAGLE